MAEPLIITVILNTNRRDDTLACLQSLARNTYLNHKTIVLDNASRDGSVASIRAAFPLVQIIELEHNLGYAGNNNVGIRVAIEQGADWVFVLNEDTALAEDCLEQLIAIGQSNPQIGIVGPMVYHYDEPDVIQSAGGRLGRHWESIHIGQNEPDRGQFPNPHPVDWISGCAILVRSAAITQAGAIDERFFYYWEETEWCLRISKHQWHIRHVPHAKLWHKGVQRDYKPKPSVTYYNTRNRLLMLMKHRAPVLIWIAVWSQLARTLVSWTIKPRWHSERDHRNAMLRGINDFLHQRWGREAS